MIGWTEARSRLKQAETPRPVSSRSTAPAKRILNALRLRPAAEKFKKRNEFGFSGTTTGRSCCVCHRAVGLFRACCRPVIVVFLTCFPRVPDSAGEAVKPLNHHKKSTTSGPGWPKTHQKTVITRDFRLKAETGSLETACTTTETVFSHSARDFGAKPRSSAGFGRLRVDGRQRYQSEISPNGRKSLRAISPSTR